MRCVTARARFPDARGARHVAACPACADWMTRVERARNAARAGASAPDLGARVLAAAHAPPASGRRPRSWARPVAAAASVALVAGAAGAWLLTGGPGPAEAVAAAATATRSTGGARFTIDGEIRVRLRLPRGVGAALPGVRVPGIADPSAPAGEVEKRTGNIGDRVEEWRRILGGGLAGLADLVPEVALGVSGDGAFDGDDRVRLDLRLGLRAPATANAAVQALRVGTDLYVRVGEEPWVIAEDRIPPEVTRPVGDGLGGFAEWLRARAGEAEPVATEVLGDVVADRYRIPLPERDPGAVARADVWIGLEDGLIHRVLLTHRVDRPFVSVTVRNDVRLRDHGAAIRLDPPEDAVPVRGDGLPPAIGLPLRGVGVWTSPGLGPEG